MLDKIDQNLSTFTTEQFEQLRDKVKQMGFNRAQVIAQTHFALKHKNKVKTLDLSFVSEHEESMQSFDFSNNSIQRVLLLQSDFSSKKVICTGFLSTPQILFDAFSEEP